MQHEPAVCDGALKPGFVFGGRALQLEQERPVDFFDIDAAVLDRLERVGEFDQLARGGIGIGERAVEDEFHAAAIRVCCRSYRT
jgi:hypothetical protein